MRLSESLASSASLLARDVNARWLMLVDPTPGVSLSIASLRDCLVAQVVSDPRVGSCALLLRGRSVFVVDDVNAYDHEELTYLLVEHKLAVADDLVVLVFANDIAVHRAGDRSA